MREPEVWPHCQVQSSEHTRKSLKLYGNDFLEHVFSLRRELYSTHPK